MCRVHIPSDYSNQGAGSGRIPTCWLEYNLIEIKPMHSFRYMDVGHLPHRIRMKSTEDYSV